MKDITRRVFLRRTGSMAALAAASAALPRSSSANPLGLPLGIQLYVVDADLNKDASATIRQIAAIGYKEVETAGFGSAKSASALRKLLDENGLKCPSAHLPLTLNNLGASFDDAHALGCTYVTSAVPQLWLPAPTPPGLSDDQKKAFLAKNGSSMSDPLTPSRFKLLADDMNNVGAAAKQAGLKFAAHNHTMELAPMDGQPGYDFLIRHTDPALVTFEIDCGWMIIAGYKPADFVNKYPGRIRMLHIKDFLAFPAGDNAKWPVRADGAEIGKGVIHYPDIFRAIEGKGVQHIFVEREGPYTRMPAIEAAAADYKYLHALT